ncbi:CPBP family intramembrane metalloprotease [Bizionia argentinensis JUB59]|uniref:CPBP family intramembrane metalloprotease n=1 Tax=Bizionia argentinensis JUB59 TaxID=1046627 RepID=G2E9V3_9FLAO|nr:CPBP family glutamic-type intramembrane protease [Bizionia argentinensis]EGV44853.1 CPBP family intramembrane metalloprotease [Bizionia argentinensis JUB59]
MYIAQAFKGFHDWWRYIIGTVAIVAAVVIGQIPFTVAVFVKAFSEGGSVMGMNEADLMGMLESNLNLFLMLLSFAGGLVGVFLVVKYLHKQSITELTTARKKIDWNRFWFAFILWGVIATSFIFLDYYSSPENYVLNFKLVPFLILCMIAIVLIPIQTSFEEYLFRGYFMQGLGIATIQNKFPFIFIFSIASILIYFYLDYVFVFSSILKSAYYIFMPLLLIWLTSSNLFKNIVISKPNSLLYKVLNRNSTPLLITSLVFGLLHIANPEVAQLGYVVMVYYIGTGLFLGVMTLMDDGLELALGFHAANNLFTALLVTADWTAFQTHSVFKDTSLPEAAGFMDVFMPVFIVFPILLYIFSRKYKWNNWQQKLFGTVKEPANESTNSINE